MLFQREEELSTLIEEFLDDNEQAFDRMGRMIIQDVVNVAYHYVGNREDAKDIAQDVLLKLYKKLKTFRHGAKLSTWVYRITVNTSIDFLRRKKKTVPLKESITRSEEKTAVEHVQKSDIQALVRRGLEQLPLRQKTVVILKHFEGLTIREISRLLGCSQSAVKTHLARGVVNLRKELEGKE